MLFQVKILFYLYSAAALFFIITLGVRPYRFSFVAKSLPVFCLAAAAFLSLPGTKGILLAAAFLFSGMGDIFLDLDRGRLFVYGLGAFLIAHLFFIPIFFSSPEFTTINSILMGVLLIYGILLGYVFFPNLPQELRIPVIVYLMIIMLMGLAAVSGMAHHYPVIVGAVFFIVSDSIIAVDKFLFKVPARNLLIMITYYLAQLLICYGCVTAGLQTV